MQKKDLKSFAGSFFITRSQLAQFLNKKDPHNIDYLLSGLDRVANHIRGN